MREHRGVHYFLNDLYKKSPLIMYLQLDACRIDADIVCGCPANMDRIEDDSTCIPILGCPENHEPQRVPGKFFSSWLKIAFTFS